jgi:hypothetical protein
MICTMQWNASDARVIQTGLFPRLPYTEHGELRRGRDSNVYALYLKTCFQMYVTGSI